MKYQDAVKLISNEIQKAIETKVFNEIAKRYGLENIIKPDYDYMRNIQSYSEKYNNSIKQSIKSLIK